MAVLTDSLVCMQVMDFADKMRAAEIEKASLEAEIQVGLQPPVACGGLWMGEERSCPAGEEGRAPACVTGLSGHFMDSMLLVAPSHCCTCGSCGMVSLQGLRDQVAQRRAEADKELKRKERLEKEMKELVGGWGTGSKGRVVLRGASGAGRVARPEPGGRTSGLLVLQGGSAVGQR